MKYEPNNPEGPALAPGPWYVAATRPRMEATTLINLEQQGYKAWLPELTLKKRRKGKWTLVEEPMFPGYVFIQLVFGEDNPAPIRSTYGCRGLVRFGSEYPPVPEELMIALLSASRWTAHQTNRDESIFNRGEWVRLESGPFAGLSAVFEMPSGKDRAMVLIDLLGAKRSVKVGMDDLGPEN